MSLIPSWWRARLDKQPAVDPAATTGEPAEAHSQQQQQHQQLLAQMRALVDELMRAPARKKVRFAEKNRLPELLGSLGSDAGPLLAQFIDDPTLRKRLGDRAVRVWVSYDRPACLARCLALADEWEPLTLMQLVDGVDMDASEVFDIVAPRYRRDKSMRELIASGGCPAQQLRHVARDIRFVDLAIEMLATDPAASLRLLGGQGSLRAIEELTSVLERTQVASEDALGALYALGAALPERQFFDVVVAHLERAGDFADGPLATLVGIHAASLVHHPRVRANALLRELVQRCERMFIRQVPVG